MSTLAITFQGPFVYSREANWVKVYAPRCADHHAAVFTVDDESPICGRARNGDTYKYELVGPGIRPNIGAINYQHSKGRILDGKLGAQADLTTAKFCLQVPLPATIYGINVANAEIVQNGGPTNNLDYWATGLRFYYDCDLTKDISLTTPEGSSIPLPPTNLAAFCDYVDIDFRHVGPDADDSEHTDAIACFDEAMKLIDQQWWLSYGQSPKPALFARTGSDCKSPAVILGR